MMLRTILMLCLFVASCAMHAQNEQKEINSIKSNKNYLYAMGTSRESAEEASKNAKDLLALEIEMWLKDNLANDIVGYVTKSQERLTMINTQRGNLFRVFAFVKKKEVLPYYKEEELMVVEVNDDKSTEPGAESPVSENMKEKTKQAKGKSVPIVYVPTDTERSLLTIRTFKALNDYISKGRSNGSISNTGKYATMPTAGTVYAFIYNREGEVPACLKVTDGKAINLSTGREDDVKNYKGCGAIWIK